MPRDVLRTLAAETGELVWAIDESRISMSQRAPAQASAGVAIVPLQGVLFARSISGWFGRIPGMDAFRAAMLSAGANPDVAAIVMDVNTPGGSYAGTPETAAVVRQVAAQKPVIAMVDTLCASAGYFIASQASEVVVTPSGELGSIGVMAVHMEMSRALEAEGVTVNILRSRTSKADVNPFEPLSDDAKAALEASIREADDEFLKAVGKGRNMTAGQVRKLVDDNGLGRVVSGANAVRLGLADRVATLGEVLAGMVKARPAAKRRSALAFD